MLGKQIDQSAACSGSALETLRNPVVMWDLTEDFGKRGGTIRVAWTGSEDYIAVSVGWQGLYVVPLAKLPGASNSCPVKSGPAIRLVDGVSQNNYISELDWRRSVTLALE